MTAASIWHAHVTMKNPRVKPGGLVFWAIKRPIDSLFLGLFRFRLVFALFQRGAQNVAERSAGIGGAVLRERFLLLGDFERLDRDGNFVGLAVESGDAGIYFLAHGKAFGPLLAAIAREIRPLDEGREFGADDLDFKTAFLDL